MPLKVYKSGKPVAEFLLQARGGKEAGGTVRVDEVEITCHPFDRGAGADVSLRIAPWAATALSTDPGEEMKTFAGALWRIKKL